jgi:hypothetical protein
MPAGEYHRIVTTVEEFKEAVLLYSPAGSRVDLFERATGRAISGEVELARPRPTAGRGRRQSAIACVPRDTGQRRERRDLGRARRVELQLDHVPVGIVDVERRAKPPRAEVAHRAALSVKQRRGRAIRPGRETTPT